MVEVLKVSFKRSHAHTTTLSAFAAGHCRPMPPPGDSWTLMGKSGSVFYGVTAPFSWVLVHTRFVPSKNLFSQSYVNSGGFMVGLMVTSSKRAYAIPSSGAPRASVPAAGHC